MVGAWRPWTGFSAPTAFAAFHGRYFSAGRRGKTGGDPQKFAGLSALGGVQMRRSPGPFLSAGEIDGHHGGTDLLDVGDDQLMVGMDLITLECLQVIEERN